MPGFPSLKWFGLKEESFQRGQPNQISLCYFVTAKLNFLMHLHHFWALQESHASQFSYKFHPLSSLALTLITYPTILVLKLHAQCSWNGFKLIFPKKLNRIQIKPIWMNALGMILHLWIMLLIIHLSPSLSHKNWSSKFACPALHMDDWYIYEVSSH